MRKDDLTGSRKSEYKEYTKQLRQKVETVRAQLDKARKELLPGLNPKEWYAKVSEINALSVDLETAKSRRENYNTGKHVPEIYVIPRK